MNVFTRWQRPVTALAAVAVAVPLALTGTASAAPARTATTFTDTTYLQDTLSLTDTSPVLETVTYDRFQWLLKQAGNFAFLIGDPADTNFKARAADVDAAAKAAGVKKVYWFDPNLSGSAKVGSYTEPNLDTRNPANFTTTLAATTATTYNYAWTNLVAQYLGNGLKATITADPTGQLAPVGEGGTVTTAPDVTVVNDATDPIFDYSSGTAAPAALDDYFFVYNKDHKSGADNDKIVSSADLTTAADSTAAQAAVTSAITAAVSDAGTGAPIAELDQSAWWRDEVNAKYRASSPEPAINPTANADAPNGSDDVISAADAADWRIQQITYPELIHLLTSASGQNAVILFGGTWCPNTRAVLKSVNDYAVENDIPVVYNFDTVLDGGWVGGTGTTGSGDQFQTRNSVNNGSTSNANPTSLYGDVISNYLANLETQYDPTLGTGSVTYYKGGATGTFANLTAVRKLQVPYLIGYQKGAGSSASGGKAGVTRQWIQQKNDVNGLPYFTEYMSAPIYTHPQPYGLGLKIPHDAPIWTKINTDLARTTWQTDPTTLSSYIEANTSGESNASDYIGASETTATVTYASNKVTVTSGGTPGDPGVVTLTSAAVRSALTALGTSAPATTAAANTALVGAEAAGTDQPLITNLSTVYAYWSIADARKSPFLLTSNSNVWDGVQFGLEAVAKLDYFFGGLPGGVVSTQTVTAKSVAYGAAPTVNVAIANQYGRVPTGSVSLAVKKGATTVASASQAVAQSAASFTLPKLAPGTYSYALTYPGDDQIAPFSKSGSLVVSKGKVSKVSGVVTKAPTTVAGGTYAATVAAPSGLAKATGTVTVKLKSGATVKTVAGSLSNGVAKIAVPKLAAGTWSAAISWPGDVNYAAATATGAVIKVAKVKAGKVAGTVSKAPTSKKAGKYKVSVATANGLAKATGTVKVEIKKGKSTKNLTGKLVNGVVTISVPKLAKGAWKVSVSWLGDANYLTAEATGKSIKVTK